MIGLVFWITLFLFGLDLVKQGTSGFLQTPLIQTFLASIKGRHLVSFLLGVIATFICQSNVGITLIAITMTQSGVFDHHQIFMIIYGTQAGTSLISFFLSFQFKGISRQIVMSQVLFKFLGSILFVALFYLELWFQIPLVKAMCDLLTPDLGQQAAYVSVFFNVPVAVLMTIFSSSLLRFLERFCPPTLAEELGQVAFINPHVTDQPETVILLSEKELLRVTSRFSKTFEFCMDDRETRIEEYETLHQANVQVFKKLETFAASAVKENHDPNFSESLTNLQNQIDLLGSIELRLSEFGIAFMRGKIGPTMEMATFRVLEAVEAAILTMTSVITSGDGYEMELLFQITSEKGSHLEECRKDYFAVEDSLTLEARLFLLDLSSHMDRIFLPLRKFADVLYQQIPKDDTKKTAEERQKVVTSQ